MNREGVIEAFGLKKSGNKGWYSSSILYCPVCGRSDKMGLLFTSKGGVVHCFHDNHYKASLKQYLVKVGREDLIEGYGNVVHVGRVIPNLGKEVEESGNVVGLPEKRLPIGFKLIRTHPYLEERGFLPYHYELFKPGITKIDLRQRDSIVFQIFDSKGVRVAWLSRSTKSKEWHEVNLRQFKEGKVGLKLRYDNSPNTSFGKILGGIPEVMVNTSTIIVVEGLFDKTNVDIQLGLNRSEEVKCLFSFGNSLTLDQINILKGFSGIKKVYLMYDFNTVDQSKRYGAMLESEVGCEVKVCEVRWEGKDPGNMTRDELIFVLEQAVSPLSFIVGKLNYV